LGQQIWLALVALCLRQLPELLKNDLKNGRRERLGRASGREEVAQEYMRGSLTGNSVQQIQGRVSRHRTDVGSAISGTAENTLESM
jgi:hypothetical protein